MLHPFAFRFNGAHKDMFSVVTMQSFLAVVFVLAAALVCTTRARSLAYADYDYYGHEPVYFDDYYRDYDYGRPARPPRRPSQARPPPRPNR